MKVPETVFLDQGFVALEDLQYFANLHWFHFTTFEVSAWLQLRIISLFIHLPVILL